MAKVPFFFFLTLTSLSKSHFFMLFDLRISRKWSEIEQTLLLPSDRKSCICHQMAPIADILHQMAILTSSGWKMQTLLLPSGGKSGFCYRMTPLRLLYIMTLNYIFKVTFWHVNISKMVRTNDRCSNGTFIDVDICHQMGSLRYVVLRYRYLHFQGHKCDTLISGNR